MKIPHDGRPCERAPNTKRGHVFALAGDNVPLALVATGVSYDRAVLTRVGAWFCPGGPIRPGPFSG